MFSDLMTFFKMLPLQGGNLLPDSFQSSDIPVSSISTFLSELDTSVKLIGVVLSLIIALLGCFFGYKFSKLFMSLTGLIFGGILGGILAITVLDLSGAAIAACVLGGAVLFAILAYWIYRAGIFILCFVLSFMAAASLLPFTGDIQFFLSTVTGFVVGSLAIKYIRPVIILTSAIVCGSSAAGLLVTVSTTMGIYSFSHIGIGALTVILCVLGITVQFLTTTDPAKKRIEKRKRKHSK
jgi:hypothetical protein